MYDKTHRNMEFGKANPNAVSKLRVSKRVSEDNLNRLLQKLQYFIIHELDPTMDNELRAYLLNR